MSNVRTENEGLRNDRENFRSERDESRNVSEELRKQLRDYGLLIEKKDAEIEELRKRASEREKGKEDELDRLKSKIIEMGDQVSNALKFKEVSHFYYSRK